MSRLDDIERYLNKATEGPWEYRECDDGDGGATEYVVGIQRNPKGWWDKDSTLLSPEDATFIANARTDLPLLLAVVGALQEEIDLLGDCPLCYGYKEHRRWCPMADLEGGQE